MLRQAQYSGGLGIGCYNFEMDERVVKEIRQELTALRERVLILENEKQALRSATAAAWSRLVSMVQVQEQKINELKSRIQDLTVLANWYRRRYPTIDDTGELMREQRIRWLVRIKELMQIHFSGGELREMAFDFGIDDEDLPGETAVDLARELLRYADRRGMVRVLVAKCLELRPRVSWPLTAVEVDTEVDFTVFFGEQG